MYKKVTQFLRKHIDDIILLIGVILISLISFAMGYIIAKQKEKEQIKILPYEFQIKNVQSWMFNLADCTKFL